MEAFKILSLYVLTWYFFIIWISKDGPCARHPYITKNVYHEFVVTSCVAYLVILNYQCLL